MNTSDTRIQLLGWQQAAKSLSMVRRQVFIEEQSVPEALEWDGLDEDSLHVLVTDKSNNPIACARLIKDGHIGRMAVLPGWRGQGIGSAMLDTLIDYCRQQGLAPFLDAQTQAIDFYRKHGFFAKGDIFMDAGIPHQKMVFQEPTDGI